MSGPPTKAPVPTLIGTSAGLHVSVTKHSPAPCYVCFSPQEPTEVGKIASILQMKKLRHSEVSGFHSFGSSSAGTRSQPLGLHTWGSWEGLGGNRAGATTHTGHCHLCQVGCPLLRPGPHTRCQPPTPAAWQILLSETKPRSCHPREDAFVAHRLVGRCHECPFPNHR